MGKRTCLASLFTLAATCTSFYFTGMYFFADDENRSLFSVNPHVVIFETDPLFLSVALDISFMQCLFDRLDDKAWQKLEKLSSLLAPAYLRFGGTFADSTFFSFNESSNGETLRNSSCEDASPQNVTITGNDWLKINDFARKSQLNLILDLNVLLRKGPEWDTTNAEAVLKFSEENGLPLDFQLGNEPNSFPHVFNVTLPAGQLAEDFQKLRSLLGSTKLYRKSKLIGPDVTRPKHKTSSSMKYLEEFLSGGVPVDVASWHQYYLNGRTVTLEDFLNPATFDLLPEQIDSVFRAVREHSENLPIWISETSSAYGGGALGLSNRFAASFLWLDKLGLAAKHGMSVVIRQSLFKDSYALIDENLTATPDFWISYFYKNAVGTKVLNLTAEHPKKDLRLYCNCVRYGSKLNGNVIVYGMNLSNRTELITTSGLSVVYPVRAFIFRPESDDLRAKIVLLNSRHLVQHETTFEDMVRMGNETEFPLTLTPYSIGFWVLQDGKKNACDG